MGHGTAQPALSPSQVDGYHDGYLLQNSLALQVLVQPKRIHTAVHGADPRASTRCAHRWRRYGGHVLEATRLKLVDEQTHLVTELRRAIHQPEQPQRIDVTR